LILRHTFFPHSTDDPAQSEARILTDPFRKKQGNTICTAPLSNKHMLSFSIRHYSIIFNTLFDRSTDRSKPAHSFHTILTGILRGFMIDCFEHETTIPKLFSLFFALFIIISYIFTRSSHFRSII
jgi:hypothetical protein